MTAKLRPEACNAVHGDLPHDHGLNHLHLVCDRVAALVEATERETAQAAIVEAGAIDMESLDACCVATMQEIQYFIGVRFGLPDEPAERTALDPQEFYDRVERDAKVQIAHECYLLEAALRTPPDELKDIYMTLKEQTVLAKMTFLMVELRRRANLPEKEG